MTTITVTQDVTTVNVTATQSGISVSLQPVIILGGGGGGGAVTSVNGQVGAVLLDADDISDLATTNKYTTQADIDRLANTSGTNTGDQVIPTNTSDLVNDGADGVNPFITAADVSTPTLQQVTTQGNTSTNNIELQSGAKLILGRIAGVTLLDVFNNFGLFRVQEQGTANYLDYLSTQGQIITSIDNITSTISRASITNNRIFELPDKSGMFAMLDDITAGSVTSVNGATGAVVLNEEDIVSTLIEPTIIAGAYTFDVSIGRAFKFSITENTTLTPPTLANSTALSFTAIVTGAFTLTAATTTITPTSDAYNGAVENRLIYDCYRTGAGVQTNILTIENLA